MVKQLKSFLDYFSIPLFELLADYLVKSLMLTIFKCKLKTILNHTQTHTHTDAHTEQGSQMPLN